MRPDRRIDVEHANRSGTTVKEKSQTYRKLPPIERFDFTTCAWPFFRGLKKAVLARSNMSECVNFQKPKMVDEDADIRT